MVQTGIPPGREDRTQKDEIMIDENIDEGSCRRSHYLEFREILDRMELISQDVRIAGLRRAYNQPDLREIMRFMEHDCEQAQIDPAWFSDLRRSLLEKNLHSLFRLLGSMASPNSDLDDLRKAVIEENLHSLFRVLSSLLPDLDLDDLRRAVLEKNLHSLFRLLVSSPQSLTDLEDLRKSVIEKNLHSLFRLLGSIILDQDLGDLRKSVLEKNLHSLFRLLSVMLPDLDLDDLRKSVIENNLHAFFRLLDNQGIDWQNRENTRKFLLTENRDNGYRLISAIYPSEVIEALKKIEKESLVFSLDSLSQGQIRSKIWLIEKVKQLDLDLGCVFICAGWYALLATLMFESGLLLEKIRSFDRDPECEKISEIFNRKWMTDSWKFKAVTMDIMQINYRATEYTVKKSNGTEILVEDIPDTVINTSCEHIENFSKWYDLIPKGTLLILQSNNLKSIYDHVNYVESLEEFQSQTPMEECLYEGELDLEQYRRFMRIGYR